MDKSEGSEEKETPSEEKETPRPRFQHRTWGTLRVFLSPENCAVVNSDRLLKMQNQGRLPGHPPGPSASLGMTFRSVGECTKEEESTRPRFPDRTWGTLRANGHCKNGAMRRAGLGRPALQVLNGARVMPDLKVLPPEEKSRSLGFARDDIYMRSWGAACCAPTGYFWGVVISMAQMAAGRMYMEAR